MSLIIFFSRSISASHTHRLVKMVAIPPTLKDMYLEITALEAPYYYRLYIRLFKRCYFRQLRLSQIFRGAQRLKKSPPTWKPLNINEEKIEEICVSAPVVAIGNINAISVPVIQGHKIYRRQQYKSCVIFIERINFPPKRC